MKYVVYQSDIVVVGVIEVIVSCGIVPGVQEQEIKIKIKRGRVIFTNGRSGNIKVEKSFDKLIIA